MKEFIVGILVLLGFALLSILSVLILPFIVVLGVFLKSIILFALFILCIWLMGKFTLMIIDYLRNRKVN